MIIVIIKKETKEIIFLEHTCIQLGRGTGAHALPEMSKKIFYFICNGLLS